MITEDYVSFETAKLLKEKGFDGECISIYRDGELQLVSSLGIFCADCADCAHGEQILTYSNWSSMMISAPTLQMVVKWLREIYKLEVRSTYDYDKDTWWGNINPMFDETDENTDIYQKSLGFDYPGKSHEQACEAAIKYCLEKLI